MTSQTIIVRVHSQCDAYYGPEVDLDKPQEITVNRREDGTVSISGFFGISGDDTGFDSVEKALRWTSRFRGFSYKVVTG